MNGPEEQQSTLVARRSSSSSSIFAFGALIAACPDCEAEKGISPTGPHPSDTERTAARVNAASSPSARQARITGPSAEELIMVHTREEKAAADRHRKRGFVPTPGPAWEAVCEKHQLKVTREGKNNFLLTLPPDWEVRACCFDARVSHYLDGTGREVIRTFVKETWYDRHYYTDLEPIGVCKHCFTFSALIDACPACEEEKRIVEDIMGSVAVTDGSVCVPKCPEHARAHATAESTLWSLGLTFDWQAREWVRGRPAKKNPSLGGEAAAVGDDRECHRATTTSPVAPPPPSKAAASWRDPRRVYSDDSGDDHEDCAMDTRDQRDNEFDELG